MSAASDYAQAVDILSKRQPAPYVAYSVTHRLDGMGQSTDSDRIVVRVKDGKVVSGRSHFKVQTGGSYDTTDSNPVSHPAFDPHCYRPTGERTSSFAGAPAVEISLTATCKSARRDDDAYPFTTLYVEPRTMQPLDVRGTVTPSDGNKSVTVALDQRFAAFSGSVMPSSFKLDLTGSGVMFWLQVHLTETYANYQFLNSYRG